MKQIFQENEIYELKEIINSLRSQWKTIVWTNWCFDILHPGHLETFKKARDLKKILNRSEEEEDSIVIVWLNWDKNPYWKTKPWRPINDEIFRSKMLEGIKYIDFIYIFNDENPSRAVDILKPDYVLKWGDYYIWKEEEDVWEEILSEFLDKIDKLVVNKNWILDITWIYKYILENNLEEIARQLPWFMPEWLVNVKNWWKVVLVPLVANYSTTLIVKKIRGKV